MVWIELKPEINAEISSSEVLQWLWIDVWKYLEQEPIKQKDIDEAILGLSAISWYNREEGVWEIIWKEALLWSKIPLVKNLVETYNYALQNWDDFFSWKLDLKTFLLATQSWVVRNLSPSISPNLNREWLRNRKTYISWEEDWIENALFICPNSSEIPNGIKYIEDYLKKNIWKISVSELVSTFHYLIVALHPFSDGNWRTARILAMSLAEKLWEPSFRSFTFISQKTQWLDWTWLLQYDAALWSESSKALTRSIKSWNLSINYNAQGVEYIEWLQWVTFEEFISQIDIDEINQWFYRIFSNVINWHHLARSLAIICLLGKDLPWDHEGLWRLISLLITQIEKNINEWNFNTINYILDESFFSQPHVNIRLKRTSIRNILLLVERLTSSDSSITISISNSFLEEVKNRDLEPRA